jgi:nucleoside 2-deoxyribosyltransferase
MTEKIQVYLAGSMFCEADRMYNAYLAEKIRQRLGDKIDLYVPQENLSINDKTKCADSHAIFWGDYNRLQKCDVFIARIDGDIPPSGTSAEIGIMSQRRQYWQHQFDIFKVNHYIAYEKHPTDEEVDCYKRTEGYPPVILGLCTDSRNPKRTYLDAKNELMKTADYESQYCYFNLFTVGCIKVNGQLTTSVKELVDAVEELVNERQ